jgi:endonuclease YncB( thermonuclease family)
VQAQARASAERHLGAHSAQWPRLFAALIAVVAAGQGREASPREPARAEAALSAALRDVPLRDVASLERVRLVCVLDGDTLDVERGGKVVRVRLASVDTEERLHATAEPIAGAPQTVFGEETALWLARLLPEHGELHLLCAPGGERHDAHGRLLAHVALPDGRDLNVLLVRAGRSPYFQRYGASEVDHEGFCNAQRAARSEHLGIWDARTNRPREAAAPRAARDYPALLAWWEARAAAIRSFRDARSSDAGAVYGADIPEDLERAARAGEPVRIFGAVDGSLELSSDALLVFIETRLPRPACACSCPPSAASSSLRSSWDCAPAPSARATCGSKASCNRAAATGRSSSSARRRTPSRPRAVERLARRQRPNGATRTVAPRLHEASC